MKNSEAWMESQVSWRIRQRSLLGFTFLSSFFILVFLSLPDDQPLPVGSYITFSTDKNDDMTTIPATKTAGEDPCLGRYIYIQQLPPRFTDDILRDCESATLPKDTVSMCDHVTNSGLGPKFQENSSSTSTSWYSTNQFMLEVVFHSRMKRYDCLTSNSSMASAIFVPLYAGLDFRRHIRGFNVSVRDSLGIDLMKWLKEKPEWKRMHGHDHFLAIGRASYDFSRRSGNRRDWGSKFLNLPGVLNLTVLIIESSKASENQVSIPYPTYFHPYRESEVLQWQDTVRASNRSVLFSFAGAKRSRFPSGPRALALRQCIASSKTCEFFNCGNYNLTRGCGDPRLLMQLFRRSVFCLQPPGDTYTRRSIFDAMVGGCIPVFFDPRTAYEQYPWYFPKNYDKFSVYIPREELSGKKPVSIERVLLGIPEKRVREMREQVVRLIPKIIYAHHESTERFEDAFDVAVKGVIERVSRLRRGKEIITREIV